MTAWFWIEKFNSKMRNAIFTIALLILAINASSQITVSGEDEILRSRVDSALSIIEASDTSRYNFLLENCDKIDFSGYASPVCLSNGAMIIPIEMINRSSVNEIAGIIVNQSMHLFFINYMIEMDKLLEDITCSAYEIDFLLRLEQ